MKWRKIAAIAAPLALVTLSACSTGFKADVARFQALPPAQGQSFVIQTENSKLQGGLEFAQYANSVAQHLAQYGYTEAQNPQSANLVVNIDYGVDGGQTKVTTRNSFVGMGGGPYWGGRRGFYHPFYYGWADPFAFSPWGYPEVESYTIYTSYLDMTINRTIDGVRLFEGKAKARSVEDSLTKLVPNLVDAMFTNFPGNSGEEVRITVPPTKK